MSNVRFYRLETLPSFEVPKHQGIFVHVTGTMYNNPWFLSDKEKPQINPETLWMEPEKVGESVERINLVKWLSTRHITEIASGLWFGGENGWELLSNETNSAAIDAAIVAKIQGLDVGGYAQAEITTTTNSSTLTIKGIQEVNGKIGIPADSENLDLDIAINGVYSQSNKIATQSTVTTAIEALDVNTAVQAVTFNTPADNDNTTLTFKGIKEVDGKIVEGDGASTFIVGDAKLKIQIGSATIDNVFSANAQSNGTIKLNEYVFQKGENDVISVITPTAVTSNNRLVTEQDIANLAGAMYYKGSIANADAWPANEDVKAGYVWIASGNFEHGNESIESGDLIVFNTNNDNSKYTIVQSNITLGTGDGQIAANVGALADGMLVVGVNSETGKGIKTVEFDVTNLTGTTGKNERKLTYDNGTPDTSDATLFHSATIKDTFKVIGKDFTETINISSTNRSIKIARNAGDGDSTGVVVDLVWNTIME